MFGVLVSAVNFKIIFISWFKFFSFYADCSYLRYNGSFLTKFMKTNGINNLLMLIFLSCLHTIINTNNQSAEFKGDGYLVMKRNPIKGKLYGGLMHSSLRTTLVMLIVICSSF